MIYIALLALGCALGSLLVGIGVARFSVKPKKTVKFRLTLVKNELENTSVCDRCVFNYHHCSGRCDYSRYFVEGGQEE